MGFVRQLNFFNRGICFFFLSTASFALSSPSPLPYTFAAGGSISASQINSNFSTLQSNVTNAPWAINGANINFAGGNVGIGSTAPGYSLDVAGYIRTQNVAFAASGPPGSSTQVAGTVNAQYSNVLFNTGGAYNPHSPDLLCNLVDFHRCWAKESNYLPPEVA